MDNYKLQHMEIDLDKPISEKNVGVVMGSGDELANTFTVSVKRGGETVDLSGCTVTGYLIMPNDETLRITGSVKDGKASVTVPKSGYVYDGAFQLAIKTVVSGKENTVAIFVGQNARTTTENISDGQRVVYGVKDILNMIDSMEQAETDAKAAATSANNAAASANGAASKANTATSNANAATTAANNAAQAATTAAGNANTATTNANNAAGAANQAAVRAENVASKSPYIGDNGNWYVYDVAQGAYVDSGSSAKGLGDVSSVNGVTPDINGNVTVFQPVNLFDNGDFQINQRGQTSYTGETTYTVDRWQIRIRESTVNVVSNGITFTAKDSSGDSYLEQKVPSEKIKTGKTYTMAALIDGAITCGSFTYSGETSGKVELTDILRVYFYNGYHMFRLGFSVVDIPHTIEWAALYEGEYTAETLPPYVPKEYVAELLECQRYYFQCNADYVFYGYIGTKTDTAYLCTILPANMRIAPTATLQNGYIRIYTGGASQDITTIDSAGKSDNAIELRFTLQTEVEARTPICGWLNGTLTLSADL